MFSILDFVNIYSVVGGAFLFLWFYSRSAYNYWRKLNVKYLKPVPFLGNTAPVLFQLTSYQEQYDRIYKALYDEPFGGIYEICQPRLIVKSPKLVSAILVKDFKHFYNRGMELMVSKDKTVDPLCTHLFLTEGERWRALRQQLIPVFTSGKLKQMHEQMLACVNLLTKYIEKQMGATNSVDVGLKELFGKLTTDVIGSCAFGIDCNALKSNEEFSEIGKEALKPRLMLVVRMIVSTFSQRLADWLKITVMTKKVNDFYMNLVLDTIYYRRQNGMIRKDLLQLVMELQNSHVDPKFAVDRNCEKTSETEQFDEIDIVANAYLFFAAGFETTASTLSFCFYELALNQDIQNKLRSEVQRLKDESKSQPMNYEILKGMTYMDAVISETLRKYPPTPILFRKCTEDYTIPGTNIQIPVGTDVAIPVWSIQHDWKNYPNPEVFNPERFVGDNKHSHPSGVFLPFGDGPRYCLGKRFAEMEIKAALAEMILKYNIRPCAKTEIPLRFKKGTAMQMTCGTWVNLVKR